MVDKEYIDMRHIEPSTPHMTPHVTPRPTTDDALRLIRSRKSPKTHKMMTYVSSRSQFYRLRTFIIHDFDSWLNDTPFESIQPLSKALIIQDSCIQQQKKAYQNVVRKLLPAISGHEPQPRATAADAD